MRALVNLILFAVAALSVFAFTRDFERVPGFYEPKLAALAASREPVDILYFGSSRIYRGVMPRVVDAELAKLGFERRSFNMAMVAMRPHEVNRYLRELLARRSTSEQSKTSALRTVVIELSHWTPTIRDPNRYTPRPIYWHDADETRSVIRSSWLVDEPFPERASLALMHALHFGARAAGLGLIPERFGEFVDGPEPTFAEKTRELEALQGFQPFPPDRELGVVAGVNRRTFLGDLPGYRAEIEVLPAENAEPGDLRHYNVEAVRDQIRTVREAGLELIYVIAPGIESSAALRRLHREGVVPTLFAFDDPETYPNLYDEKNRFDRRHLNTRGARIFSTLLARRLASHWDSESD